MAVAVFCPTTPLLVEGMSGGRLDAVEALRAAVRAALKSLLAAQPSSVTVVGVDSGLAAAAAPVRWPASCPGGLAGFGVAVEPGAMLGGAHADASVVRGPDLPSSLAVGRWLLHDSGFEGDVRQWSMPVGAVRRSCLSLGQTLRGRSLLLLGDASMCHGENSPGGPHPLAPVFDALVVQALAAGDVGELMALDVRTAASLGVTGWATWQVLAGWTGSGQVVDATVDYYDAPFGVGYVVGHWSVDPPDARGQSSSGEDAD